MHLLPSLLFFLLMQAEPAPEPVAAPAPAPEPAVEPAAAPIAEPAVEPAAEPQQVFPVSIAASVAGALSRQGGSSHGEAGEGQLAVDWFARRPVVDDGTPYGLQPYLQRADRLSLGVEGSLSSATVDTYSDKSFATRFIGLFYRGWVVFGGQVDYAHFSARQLPPDSGLPPEELHQILRPSVTFGLRDQALELRVSYVYTAYFDDGAPRTPGWGGSYIFTSYFDDRTFRTPGWGQCKALMTLVLDNSTYFSLTGFASVDGGGGAAKYETFPNPRVGLWLEGDYQEEQIDYFDGVSFRVVGYTMAHVEIGAEWWHSNRFALLGWLSGGMLRGIQSARSAFGTETPFLELVANLGIVTRMHGR